MIGVPLLQWAWGHWKRVESYGEVGTQISPGSVWGIAGGTFPGPDLGLCCELEPDPLLAGMLASRHSCNLFMVKGMVCLWSR